LHAAQHPLCNARNELCLLNSGEWVCHLSHGTSVTPMITGANTCPVSIWKPGGRQRFNDELPEHPPATHTSGHDDRCTSVHWLVAECG
jgi:hypothetical protein